MTTANDTFANSQLPNSTFGSYQRPDSPYYYELWHGKVPGTSYYNEAYIRFNSLVETLGSVHIDSASFQFYPYWQYYHYEGRPTWVRQVTSSWASNSLTWNNRPSTAAADIGQFDTQEGVWSDIDLTGYVQDILNGAANNGLMLHANGTGQGNWKRIVSRNDPSNLKPKLVVTWTPFAAPTVVYPNGGGETSSRTLTWQLPPASTQTAFEAQIATDNGFTAGLVTSGTVTSSTAAWMIPATTTLVEGTTYYWRAKVKYGANTTFSAWPTASGTFTYRQGASLGLPEHDTFESFGLGNGDTASVNVSTGNLVLTHPIVSLPIRGGALSLALTYNSQSTANAGTGPGWRLDATRRLTELGNGNVVFTAGDGSAHTFTKIATVGTVTTYTRPATIYGTLVKDTSLSLEWKLTYRDQSADSFDLSGSDGLLARQADRFGNAVTFSYYSGTNRLQQATDPAGRVVAFAWDTGVSPARLTTITDWAYDSGGVVQAGATGSRRQDRLFYDAGGNLAGWANPFNTTGSCPAIASHLTCLEYDANGLVTKIKKRQTPAAIVTNTILTGTPLDITNEVIYRGNEVKEFQDGAQDAAGQTGTTFARIADKMLQVVRQGSPASTMTYGYVASTDTLGRVESVWRRLGTTDIEQRTVWNTSYPIEPTSATDNYGALLNTPARTVSFTYVGSSMGLVARMTEPLTATTNRTTDYTYNANNDVTEQIVALDGSGTTRTITRYCYTTSGCATSGTALTLNSVIENYVDGSKGGASGNEQDVTTDYLYDANGQRTRETRWNYDAAGNLLDSRAIGYTYDGNGNQTAVIVNYADGDVQSGDPYDVNPDPATGARTDLTTTFAYDTAGNQISSVDPRRAIAIAGGQSLDADDYVTRTLYDVLDRAFWQRVARDPADATAPPTWLWIYDEMGAIRQATDLGGLMSASEYDRAGRPTRTFEDPDGAGGTNASVTSITTFDAAGRALTSKDRRQAADSSLGATATSYDDLGRATDSTDASGSSPDASSTTRSAYDALDRQTSLTVGYGGASAQVTTTTYDLGGRMTATDDEFTCATSTYDYRDLGVTEATGLVGGTCASGAATRTLANAYDGLGRLTRTEVTAGTGTGDRTLDVTLDGVGRQLTSAVKTGGVTRTTTFSLNPLDQTTVEARPDGSTAKTNFDPAGNATDRCYWKPSITVGSCYEVGHGGWTNPPTQVTTSKYDSRNNRIELSDSSTGATTTYDPDHNYAIKAFYVPTGSGREHQTLYAYDARHRLTSITHQLCVISSGHSCSSTTATGSDAYSYDDNDNRTTVNESNGATSSDRRYCHDAQNRLQYRNTGAACSSSAKDETYTYDDAGNRLTAPSQTFTYNGSGQLTGCTTNCGTVNHDSAGNISRLGSWVYEYDSQGRLTRACKSTACSGSIDKVEFTYDGEGHRTQTREYTAGTLTTTRDFRYHGDAIVEESTNGTVSRGYVVDEIGRIVRFCDPNCASPTTSYLVTWNGHGDALAAWRINGDGTLSLANSYTYSTWGAPTTTVASGYTDLGFRFLYVGGHDVQWDNFSGLGLHYMHARHYAPVLGRFVQPDPAAYEMNLYSYVAGSPITKIDPTGTRLEIFASGGGGSGGGGGDGGGWRQVQDAAFELGLWLIPTGWITKARYVRSGLSWLRRWLRPSTRAAQILSNQAAGRIIGWPTGQAAAGRTAQMARNLTASQVANMKSQGLNRATVEHLRAMYGRAFATGGSKLRNEQLIPRAQLMDRILELWPK